MFSFRIVTRRRMNSEFSLGYCLVVPGHDRYRHLRADLIFQTIRKTFGLQTFLLRVNSAMNDGAVHGPSGITADFWPQAAAHKVAGGQIWTTHITQEDVDATRDLVGEFVTQHLIPHMERTVATLNEQVANARRGITGRLFTAGRRYFGVGGPSKSPTSASSFTDDGFMTWVLRSCPFGPDRGFNEIAEAMHIRALKCR